MAAKKPQSKSAYRIVPDDSIYDESWGHIIVKEVRLIRGLVRIIDYDDRKITYGWDDRIEMS